jgi:hypothetical protein
VISTGRGLVRYFSLGAVFTVPINSTGLVSFILHQHFLELLLSCFVPGSCFHFVDFALVWFVLNSLAICELLWSHLGFQPWLQKALPISPHSIGSLQLTSRIRPPLMSRLISRRRLPPNEMSDLMRRMSPTTPTIAGMSPTMVVARNLRWMLFLPE